MVDRPASARPDEPGFDHGPQLARAGKLGDYFAGMPGHGRGGVLAAVALGGAAAGVGTALALISVGLASSVLTAGAGAALLSHARRQTQGVRHRLRHLAHMRAVRSEEIVHLDEGTPVRLRGRVRARDTVPSVLTPARRGVWRVVFAHEAVVRQRLLFAEHAWDFELVPESGPAVRVQVTHARLLHLLIDQMPWVAEMIPVNQLQCQRVFDLLPESVRGERHFERTHLRCWELLVEDGCELEVYGFATHVIGPGAAALPREAPRQPALRAFGRAPLVAVPGPAPGASTRRALSGAPPAPGSRGGTAD
ncbi:hypothetical protein [Haliangium ochraceum]|uniref:Uncharacterized protein n=1 Tax=Haliangium ochraceum (strain DSM 14365 / JCM 11303 / SMP-2) TaxID=502025 RepID=D0LLY4_HALO1|nr:hypothetical protein [Haliangium ochraceum]ACY15162.1 hypothetical protein Hoch_2629 [Haliangium ochraceum DSM 14365]